MYLLHDVTADPFQERPLTDAALLAALRERLVALRTGPGAAPPELLGPREVWEIRMSRSQGYW